ncbi:OLC1v1009931C1 [Oldenlandia corymbosa var. corymbosa]|uniref:OLC1v1009931C1 n=1 Tax=Oldenlandia corymbosa var. corymbosa TaxID=529605 RepID=A0AAV1DRP2_OLDCO|nr:OLC1v1009931C1 [Oldenlandia corymbosa var. corymbosa]
MAGLLAWAADVVGAGGQHNGEDDDPDSIPLIFTPEQLVYAQELDRKAASLNRSIQDLRLRLPPPDLSQRLPHLHAHSLASNAALALQLNAHSATKEQVQSREIRLQEENGEYEKVISSCEIKVREKLEEANMLQNKLKELDVAEKNLELELESAQAALASDQSERLANLSIEVEAIDEANEAAEDAKSAIMYKLETKRQELASIEEIVQNLEKQWAQVQDDAMKKPSPAQREKILDKQLHSLIEQLEVKQIQAERLVNEIHLKETELERLNGLSKSLESSTTDVNIARNRYRRTASMKGHASSDFDSQNKAGRTESLQRLMLLRSAFVVYILALHILVFIKISF